MQKSLKTTQTWADDFSFFRGRNLRMMLLGDRVIVNKC